MRLPAFIFWPVLLSAFRAAAIETIPNASFESPTATFPSPLMDSWQKTAKPDWFDESGGFSWVQLTGEFTNPSIGAADRIDNCDAAQAAWMFVVPQVGIFQDYDNPTTHAFNATYEVGKSYRLTVGIIGTGGSMSQGVTIELALYYRDAASNMVVVAATSVTNSSAIFSNNTHFIDFHADSGFVKTADAWAAQHIGVRILSTITDTNMEGGYWDLDNVRLTATPVPSLTNPVWTNGQFSFVVQSEPGMVLELQKTTNSTNLLDGSIWSNLGVVTNDYGTTSFTDTNAISGQSYYRAQLVQ